MTRLLRLSSIPSLLLILAVPNAARAQGATTVTFNGFAGLSLAAGSFGERNDAGYSLGAGVGARQGLSPLAFRAEGMYNEYSQKFAGSKAHSTSLTGNAIYELLTDSKSGFVPSVASATTARANPIHSSTSRRSPTSGGISAEAFGFR